MELYLPLRHDSKVRAKIKCSRKRRHVGLVLEGTHGTAPDPGDIGVTTK